MSQKPVEQLMAEAWEDLKLKAARTIYHKQNEYTPSKGFTWKQWWEMKYGDGESYIDFVERMKREKDAVQPKT